MLGAILMADASAVFPTDTKKGGEHLQVVVDKTAARVGDRIRLTLTYGLPDGARLPDPPVIEGIEGFTVVTQKVREGHIDVNLLVDRLASFEIGPIGLGYIDLTGKKQRLEADPVNVAVLSNLDKAQKEVMLKPIRDIVPTIFRWHRYLPWAIIAAVLLGLGAGAWFWRHKRSSRVTEFHAVEPPHVRADRELNMLIKDALFERGEFKAFYFRLSEIIRRYMEDIRGFPAAEMTTEEIARKVGANGNDQVILALLRQADLVKFADTVPSPSRKDKDILDAHMYIHNTATPVWETTEASPAIEVAS